MISARQAIDQCRDASRFRAGELAILEVYVVDDLSDGCQRGFVEAALLQQHFECAAIPLVGEFCFEHVEAQLARPRPITLRRNKLE